MTPLFPVPLRLDFRDNTWGASGRERILVRGDLLRPSRRARQFLAESLNLGRNAALTSVDDLESPYCELIVRAWLAAHRDARRHDQGASAEAAIDFLDYHVLCRMNRQWRLAMAQWLDKLIVQPQVTTSILEAFGPRQYVEAMSGLLGAHHPYAHEGPAGDEQAKADHYL